ncbi:MAG: hypothetical protein STSR0009_18240 [Methanoregula sp.]
MFPVVNNHEAPAFEFPDVPGYLRERVPTFDRALDQYFDEHFSAIIDEWELLRDNDLKSLEQRMSLVVSDIDTLSRNRDVIRDRAHQLDVTISLMEGSL